MNKKCYFFTYLFTFLSITLLAQTVSISGVVTRHNGMPEAGVTVHCTNATSVITGVDGVFTFTDLPSGGDYAISATKESDPNEFITVLDALKTGDIILTSANSISTFQTIVGDVNNSSIVSTIDLVVLLKIADRIQGITNPDYWKIFGADFNFNGCVYSGTPAECIGIFLENVTADATGLQMIATKLGDVAIDADHFPPPVGSPEPLFYFENQSVAQNEEFEVEILVEDFKQIAGFQHTLIWNPAIIEFIAVEDLMDINLLANEDFAVDGQLPVLGTFGNSLEGTTIDESSVLYSLRFKALSEVATLAGVLEFSDDLIEKQVVYRPEIYELYLLNHNYETAVTTSNSDISNLKSFEIFPNPVDNQTVINASFNQTEKVELVLFNSVGQVVQHWDFEGMSIRETLFFEDLPQGAYILKLITGDGFTTKNLVKL